LDRFTGSAGSQMSNRCPVKYSCGSHGGFWTNAPMPTVVGEIHQVAIYGSWNGDCSWLAISLYYYNIIALLQLLLH